MIADSSIGQVIETDISRGTIQVLITTLNTALSQYMNIGLPLVIESNNDLFYCIIVNHIQRKTDSIIEFARTRSDIESLIPIKNAGFDGIRNFDEILELSCLCIMFNYSEKGASAKREGFVSIPKILSPVRIPSHDEIHNVYARSHQWKPYWIGTLASQRDHPVLSTIVDVPSLHAARELFIPIDMSEMIQKPLGIFGSTGFGKTVTTRNLCKAIIHDPEKVLQTSMLIFDVMNEYAKNTHSRGSGNLGLLDYPDIQDKITVFAVDKVHADRNHIPAEQFFIYSDNISSTDIIQLLANETFTDNMRATIMNLEELAHDTNSNLITVLEEYAAGQHIDQTASGNKESSFQAMQWRIRDLLRHDLRPFLRERSVKSTQLDTFETIRMQLDRSPEGRDSKLCFDKESFEPKSFIIYFGRYGSNKRIYKFIANLLARKLYRLYTDNMLVTIRDQEYLKYNQLVMLVEEAHKFIGKDEPDNVFQAIARETRKYGLTVFLVDQCPSTIDETIVAQLSNRILHRLTGSDDIRVALAGLDVTQWRPIINTLNRGNCIVFGEMVNFMPTIFWSYFANVAADELLIRGLRSLMLEPVTEPEIKLHRVEEIETVNETEYFDDE